MSPTYKSLVWSLTGLTSLLLFGTSAFATGGGATTTNGPSTFSYEGRVTDTSGNASQDTVTFTVQIWDPGLQCLLREESTAAMNLATSNGYFSVSIGSNTLTANDAGLSVQAIFSNHGTISTSNCNYSPASGDGRKVRIIVNDQTAGTVATMAPDINVGTSPFAVSADTLQGLQPSAFLAVNNSTAAVTQSNLESVFASTANISNLLALISNTSAHGSPLPTVSAAPAAATTGSIWYNSSTNSVQYYNGTAAVSLGAGSSGTVTAVTAGAGLSGGTITGSGTISLPTTGTAGTYAKVSTDPFGRVLSGSSLLETDLPTIVTAGKVSGSALTSGTIAGTTSLNTSGAITTTGVITGSSLSTSTSSTQSSRIFNTGNTFSVNLTAPSLTSSYNFVLPLNPGTAGYVLSTDGTGNTSWVAGGGSPSGTATGDLAGAYPNPVVAKLNGTTLSTTGLTAGQYLRYNGSTWQNSSFQSADLPTQLAVAPGSASSPSLTFNADPMTGEFLPATGNLAFATGGNERMRISNTGLIGIGTTSPSFTLDVVGTGRVAGSFTIGGSENVPSIYGSTAAGGTLTLDSTSSATKGAVVLAPVGGSVGVGTASPTGVFSSVGTSTATGASAYNQNSSFTVSPTASSTAVYFGDYNYVNSNSAYLSNASMVGQEDILTFSGSNLGSSISTWGQTTNSGSGAINNSYGGRFASVNVSGGTITSAYGSQSSTTNSGTGTITAAYGSSNSVTNTAAGTITTAYGTYSAVPSGSGSTAVGYGVYIGDMTGASTRFGLYESDASASNYFAGNVGIGVTSPTVALQVQTATTNAAVFTSTNVSAAAVKVTGSGTTTAALVAANTSATGPSLQVGNNGSTIAGIQLCSYTTTTAYTPNATTPATYTFTCTNVPATGAVVSCSPSGITMATGVTWSAYASAANNVVINVAATQSTGTSIPVGTVWRCSVMY